MSRATHGASTRWLWSAHQSLHPQNSLQKLVIRTRFCSHSLVEELLQSDSEVALRHAVASDCDEFVSGESALDLRGERNRTVRSHGENYDFYQHRAPEIKVSHLLWVMWLLTRCPAARAAIRESSPASTVPHTTRASWRAFSPGSLELEPWTPSIYRRRRSLTSEREDEQLEDGSLCFTYRNISSGFHVSVCNL